MLNERKSQNEDVDPASQVKISPRSIIGIYRQQEQFQTLLDFKNGKFNVLIATDVAEDGLDVRTCQLVINFDLPPTLKSMIQVSI